MDNCAGRAKNWRRHGHARRWAYSWAATTREPFSIDAITAIHERIAAADGLLAAHAGRVRERQNWIGSDPYTAGADFIPPPPEVVRPLLEDLCDFLNRVDLPPVAQAAIAHVQFETIHPSPDGNGRVGRALLGASLSRSGICRDVVPPISLVLAGRKADYIEALTAFRRETTTHGSSCLRSPRRRLHTEPVLNVERAATRLGRSSEAVRQALNRLQEAGVVQLTTVAKRDRAWESIGVFALVDEMERRLGAGVRRAAATH